MEVKIAKPVNFLFHASHCKVHELVELLPVGQQLIAEAVRLGISVTGPVHWHYFDFDGDESKAFRVEVCVPVGEVVAEYDGQFHFKRTDSFKCVSLTHEGAWLDIPSSYGKAMAFIADKKLKPTLNNREIYINADFKFPEANVTEIQIGVD